MAYESPLLKRVKDRNDNSGKKGRKKSTPSNGSPKFTIPEKGRGRIVLIVILMITGYFFYSKKAENTVVKVDNSSKTTKNTKEESGEKAAKVGKKRSIKAPVKPIFSFAPKTLDFSDIKETIKGNPPSLKQACDTVTWKRRKVIRYFSLDTNLQNLGNIYMKRYHPKYGAVVILQPRTGRVLSLVSYNNPEEKSLGNKLFTNAMFPAASVIKTITAATVIDKNGLTSKSLLKMNGKRHTLYKSQLKKDLKVSQEVTLGDAFAYSINPVFGRLGIYYAGANTLYGYAEKFGFNEPVPFEWPVSISQFKMPVQGIELAEVASGFNQTTTLSPILGALIAGSVSNKGKMIRPTFVDSVIDLGTAKNIYTRSPKLWRITTSPSSAKELEKLMINVGRYGSARTAFKNIKNSSRFRDFKYGGKTGHVDKDGIGQANWFIGFMKGPSDPNQQISCGVLTVQGAKWTVHSSTVAADLMSKHLRDVQIAEKKQKKLDIEKEVKAEKESDKNNG